MLTAAPLHEQKTMFGERLYPIIQTMHPNMAGKLTGMLLELDNSELLQLLDSPEALTAKVQEAMAVVQAAADCRESGCKVQQKAGQTIGLAYQDALNASMLAAVSPEEQKTMFGERLFPIVQSMHPKLAGKMTGMLLELDNGELLHLLDSPEALTAKVEECLHVLQEHDPAT